MDKINSNVVLEDNLQCKFNPRNFKILYVINSENCFYRKLALTRAKNVSFNNHRKTSWLDDKIKEFWILSYFFISLFAYSYLFRSFQIFYVQSWKRLTWVGYERFYNVNILVLVWSFIKKVFFWIFSVYLNVFTILCIWIMNDLILIGILYIGKGINLWLNIS